MKKADTAIGPPPSAVTRGRHAHLLQQGSNIAVLDPDIVDHFPDSESVNTALRAFLAFASAIPGARRPIRRATTLPAEAGFDPRKGIPKGRKAVAK